MGAYLVPTQIGLTGISFRWLRKIFKTFAGNRNYRIIKKQRKKCEGSEGVKWERGLVLPVYMRNMGFGPLGLSKFALFQ